MGNEKPRFKGPRTGPLTWIQREKARDLHSIACIKLSNCGIDCWDASRSRLPLLQVAVALRRKFWTTPRRHLIHGLPKGDGVLQIHGRQDTWEALLASVRPRLGVAAQASHQRPQLPHNRKLRLWSTRPRKHLLAWTRNSERAL